MRFKTFLSHDKSIKFFLKVVHQFYDPGLVDKEYVMRGNAAIMKCLIPSFVADFVYVEAWVDENGQEYKINSSRKDDDRLSEGKGTYLDV